MQRFRQGCHFVYAFAVIAVGLLGAAHGREPLRAELQSLEGAAPELIQGLRADPFTYFRFVNRPWIARVCDVFGADLRDLPIVRLHGDAHVEQFALAMLLLINFFGHYLFASVTAHVTAMIPVLLAVASTIPGVNMHTLALGLCLQLGIMGILTPYASGPSPVYYGSGYLPAADYWRLGAIFGVIFFAAFLVIGVPWMLFIR